MSVNPLRGFSERKVFDRQAVHFGWRLPIGWTMGVMAGLPAGVVYLITMAASITWRNNGADSGDLVAAAFTLGIPHPPGYPLYTLIAAAFAHLPVGEPAHNVSLFSALAAAIAVALFSRAAELVLPGGLTRWQKILVAVSIALAVAFAPLFWSQATIAEVYALNALLVAALLSVLLSDAGPRLEISAVLFGLGFAHHYSIVWLVPTAALLLRDSGVTRARIIRAIPLFLVPLCAYAYLPIRAAAMPPINWGDPDTVEGFWWTISAAPYRPYLFELPLADVLERVATTARLLFQQFNAWGVLAGLWGIAELVLANNTRIRRRAIALLMGAGLYVLYAVLYATRDSDIYLLPAFILFALFIAVGVGDVLTRLADRRTGRRIVLAGALLLLPMFNLVMNFQSMDLSHDREALGFAEQVFDVVPVDAVVFGNGDERTFALWYYRYVRMPTSRVVPVSPELLQFDWYYDEMRERLDLDLSVSLYDARVKQIVDQSLSRGRAVYTTSKDGLFQKYPMESLGMLYQIRETHP